MLLYFFYQMHRYYFYIILIFLFLYRTVQAILVFTMIKRQEEKAVKYSKFKSQASEQSVFQGDKNLHKQVKNNQSKKTNKKPSQPKQKLNYQLGENDAQNKLELKQLEPKFFSFLNEFNQRLQNLRAKNKDCDQSTDIMSQLGSNINAQKINSQIKVRRLSSSSASIRKRRNSRDKTRQSFSVIEANLENGKINGEAKLILHNGGIFSGLVEDGDLKSGRIVYQSGLEYEGLFQNNLFHGMSVIRSPQGNTIHIEWNKGIVEETGTIQYPNGDIYKGQVKNFKKHGIGQLTIKDSKKYVGQFYKGQINGEGILYTPDKQIIAKGVWHQGKFIGEASCKENSNSDTDMSSF